MSRPGGPAVKHSSANKKVISHYKIVYIGTFWLVSRARKTFGKILGELLAKLM